jgi:rhamnogalacturonan endolyase
MKKLLMVLTIGIMYDVVMAQPHTIDIADLSGGKLVASDDFSKPGLLAIKRSGINSLSTNSVSTIRANDRWVIEMAPLPGSAVYTKDNKLVLDTKGGVTVWLNQLLKNNLRIEYDRKVIAAGGVNNRLSDLNNFWMASDPRNKNLFTRNGVLESYDSLQLYYVGMGGNSNKTTRFRKYEGNGERRLLQEYTDSTHLLQANKVYHITIVVKDGATSYWVDGNRYFFYNDPAPLKEGYFGFRSTKSHQEISGFKVYQLD